MRRYLLIGLVLLAGLLVTPAMAGYEGASGMFFHEDGSGWNITNVSGSDDLSVFQPHIVGIFFPSASAIVRPGALKVYLNCGMTDWVTTISNNTFTDASLAVGGTTFSTGTFHIQRNSVTGDVWLSYFPTTWDSHAVPDDSYAVMSWNHSVFDIKWERAASPAPSCDRPEIQNNPLGFAYYTGGAPAWCIYPSIPPRTGGYFELDYFDRFYLGYETTYQTDAYSNLVLTKQYEGTNYYSLVTVNRSSLAPGFPDATIYSAWSANPSTTVLGIMHGIKHHIYVTDPEGNKYDEEFYANYTGAAPTNASVGSLIVYTWDGSRGALLNNVLVTQKSITWPSVPAYNKYGYTGIAGTFGQISLWGKIGHEYNLTAEYVGYSTAYTNVTVSHLPTIVHLYLFRSVGYDAAEFFLTDEDNRHPSGVPVKLFNTTSNLGKLSVNGFARFPVASGANYEYLVADGMGHCSDCYKAAAGNFTATSGVTRIYINLTTWGDEGTDAEDTTVSDPHAAAESVMKLIYGMLPSLLMLVFLFLFLGVMGYTPGRRRR